MKTTIRLAGILNLWVLFVLPLFGKAQTAEVSAPPDPYVVPGRFFQIPRHYGVIAPFTALAATPDGKIYMGTSTYNHPSQILELDSTTGEIKLVVDLARELPQDDSEYISHSKIHTSIEVSADGNMLYYGTHTGETQPASEYARDYLGGHFMAYNRATGKVTDYGIGRPQESLMRIALDERRERLYAMTYPRGHLMVCDMKQGRNYDLGKASISSYSSPRVAWDGKVYFASKLDEFSCFDPDTGRIEKLKLRLPDRDGVRQSLSASGFSVQSRDRKRQYGLVMPGKAILEWDVSRPPGKLRYLCGPISGSGPLLFSAMEDAIYWFGDVIGKYDFAEQKMYTLGRLKAGEARLCGVWASCAAPNGKLYLGGLRGVKEGRNGVWGSNYGQWDVCGFWEYDPAVEKNLLKEAVPEPPAEVKPRKPPDALRGFVDLNEVLPYGESSLRAMIRLPDGDLLGATIGENSHLVLIADDPPTARDLGCLPSGEFPAYNGLVLDKDDNILLATIGNIETIYRLEKTPDGKLYRVLLTGDRKKADLKPIVTPFAEDGIYAMAVNHSGTELAGVTFPGGRLFTMALLDGKPMERAVLTKETRPQMEDSCSLSWMQIRIGCAVAYDAAGNLYAGADSDDLVVLAPGAATIKRHRLPLACRRPASEVTSLAPGADGRIYIGTLRGYLLAFDPATAQFANLGRPARQGDMRALVWQGGRLYGLCGEQFGASVLFGYDPNGQFHLPTIPMPIGYELQFLSDSLQTLVPEPDGTLWVGGAGRMTGITRMQP